MRRVVAVAAVVAMAAAAALVSVGWVEGQQRDWSAVEINAEKIRGNVHVLISNAAGNIGVSAGEDGILIVDDKFLPLADKIRAALRSINPGKLKFVLNTHYHGDHTGANAAFGPEAPIIAHTNVRKRLREGVPGRNVQPAPKEAWPVVTFDHSLSVHFNGEEIKSVYFPNAHTDGDIVIFFTGSNVVHLGDNFFAGRFPFVDIDGGGDVEGLTRAIGSLLTQIPADAALIPGHGPVSSLDDLRTYHAMLVETTEHVRAAMRAGKSADEIVAAGLPEKWKGWAWGFINEERWIRIIHRSLSGAPASGHFRVPRGRDGHGHPHPHQ